jgi:hypothetical protein
VGRRVKGTYETALLLQQKQTHSGGFPLKKSPRFALCENGQAPKK